MSNTSAPAPTKQTLDHFSRIQRVDESVFLGLQVTGGQILLPLLVLTIIFSRNVHRNPVFINFCCSWIFSSIIYSLLVYRGRSDAEDLSLSPSAQECLIQASLINGISPLTACSTLGIAIELLSTLLSAKTGVVVDNAKKRHLSTLALLILPYIILLVLTVVSAVVGNQLALDARGNPIPDSNLAIPGVFYCIVLLNSTTVAGGASLARASLYCSLVTSASSLFLEAFTVITLMRNRRIFRRLLPEGRAQLLARIVVFSLYRFALLCLMFESPLVAIPDEFFLTGISDDPLYNGIIDFMQATVPLVVFLVFASEKDILDVWCFWRKKSIPALEKEEYSTSAKRQTSYLT